MITPMTTAKATNNPPIPPPKGAMRFPEGGASVSVITINQTATGRKVCYLIVFYC